MFLTFNLSVGRFIIFASFVCVFFFFLFSDNSVVWFQPVLAGSYWFWPVLASVCMIQLNSCVLYQCAFSLHVPKHIFKLYSIQYTEQVTFLANLHHVLKYFLLLWAGYHISVNSQLQSQLEPVITREEHDCIIKGKRLFPRKKSS